MVTATPSINISAGTYFAAMNPFGTSNWSGICKVLKMNCSEFPNSEI